MYIYVSKSATSTEAQAVTPRAEMSSSAVVQSALMQDLSCHPTNCNKRERATSETGKLEPQ